MPSDIILNFLNAKLINNTYKPHVINIVICINDFKDHYYKTNEERIIKGINNLNYKSHHWVEFFIKPEDFNSLYAMNFMDTLNPELLRELLPVPDNKPDLQVTLDVAVNSLNFLRESFKDDIQSLKQHTELWDLCNVKIENRYNNIYS